MSSCISGVKARIKKEASLATYVHCNGHCLDLVISKSCALPQVRNVIERPKNCCRFFLKSPKRSGLLEIIVKQNIVNVTKRRPLLDLCKTRWAERQTAYQHFYQAVVFIVEALEMIGFKRHLPKYSEMYADWNPANRNEAQQILASISSFEFIVVLMTLYQYLAHLAGITVKLQRAIVDTVEAHDMITEVRSFCRKEREDCGTNFPVFAIKAFQWLRRWVLLPKRPDWHQDNCIAPMLRPKLLESISKETWQFLYSIILSCVSKSSFRLRQKLPHHYLASFQVFSVQEMSTSMRLLTLILMISRPLSCSKWNLRDGEVDTYQWNRN